MGRTILITGTSRGIGRAVAERFAEEEEVTILAHARRESEDFLTFLGQLRTDHDGCDVEPLYFDLSDEAQTQEILSNTVKRHKRIDVLVNNAGILPPVRTFLTESIEDIKDTFAINFFAQIRVTQMVCHAMIRNGGGAIVNVSSIAASHGAEGHFDYSCSKGAVSSMTRMLAKELAPYHIRCNEVAPGMINTDMNKGISEEQLREMLQKHISARLGSAEEIAGAIYFLASEEASFVNGQSLIVNGGV